MITRGKPVLVVSGGVTSPSQAEYRTEMDAISEVGMRALWEQKTALDAVEIALAYAEDNPLFNCGTGCALNLNGEGMMDACIVDGATGKSGAVTSISRVRNPIVVARKVMEETDHCLLAGEGAVEFARALGFEDYDPVTESRRKEWHDLRRALTTGEEIPEALRRILAYWTRLPHWAKRDRDPAVLALDLQGGLAAGISSGGAALKLPGRVGDAAIVGASVYARNGCGAAALSGHGEVFMREFAARWICEQMASGITPQEATQRFLARLNTEAPGAVAVAIAIDPLGRVGGARNVATGPHVCVTGEGERISDFACVMPE